MLVIKPFEQYWALKHGLLQNETYQRFNELNPHQNAFIKRLLILRYNYLRQYKMYTLREYWDKMPLEEQLTAEAMSNYYLAGYKHFSGLQYDLALDLLKLKKSWDNELYSYMISHVSIELLEPSIDDLFKNDLTYQLINPKTKGRNRMMNLIWYQKYGIIQDIIHTSENLFLRQIAMQWRHNELKNTPAKPLLLKNKDIPLPNYATFPTWYNLLGHQITRLNEKLVLISFTLPHIPMTSEHLTHGNPAVTALDANESISYRNATFEKDSYGNINYGLWEVHGIILRDNGKNNNITSMTINGNSALHSIARTILMMYDSLHPNYSGIYPKNLDLNLLACLGPMRETSRFNTPITMKDSNLDYGMKLLSRNYNVHFMFTDRVAADLWILAYIESARAWLTSNINKFNESMLNELVTLPNWPPVMSHKAETIKELGVDIAGLFNAPI